MWNLALSFLVSKPGKFVLLALAVLALVTWVRIDATRKANAVCEARIEKSIAEAKKFDADLLQKTIGQKDERIAGETARASLAEQRITEYEAETDRLVAEAEEAKRLAKEKGEPPPPEVIIRNRCFATDRDVQFLQ